MVALGGFLELLGLRGRAGAEDLANLGRSVIPQAGTRYGPLSRARRSYTVGVERPNRADGLYVADLTTDQWLRRRLPEARAQQRHVCRTNDYGRNFLRLCQNNLIGDRGVLFENRAMVDEDTPDDLVNNALEAEWKAWRAKGVPTTDGERSWLDVENIIAAQVPRDGEILIREVPFWPDNEFRYAIQLIAADRLDESKNGELRRGFETRLGVERDSWGRRTGYWLRTADARARGESSQWVSAEDFIHLYFPEDADQSRGVPWGDTTTRRMRMASSYEQHALHAAHAGASKMGFFYQDEVDGYTDRDKLAEEELDLAQVLDAGSIEALPPGVKFEGFDPGYPDGDMPVFMKLMFRGAATGYGVSYNLFAGDLEGVNMSSLRHGLNSERDGWKRLQGWLIESLHARVQRNWLAVQLTTGRLPFGLARMDEIYRPQWYPRRWPWVDPKNETEAAQLELNMGINSRTNLAGERGRDVRRMIEEKAAEEKLAADKETSVAGDLVRPVTAGSSNDG